MVSPDPSDPPDAALESLIGAVLTDDPQAVDRWFRGEHPHVYRLCFGFLANAEEADDVSQDAMLHLLDKLPTYDTGRPYRGWRNTVVLNLCRSHTRKTGARRAAESSASEAGLPDRLPRPEVEAERAETRSILQEALAALSPREREVFVLRDLEGLATPEVAAALDVGESTVRSLSTLARRRLRRLLGPRLSEMSPESGGGHA